ncbi:MAG: hypothetical protein QM639_10735 [Rhodocyclaceae bacterium]
MAEAEDVITDVARHATSSLLRLWNARFAQAPRVAVLQDHLRRIQLLAAAVTGTPVHIHVAQAEARPSLLAKWFNKAPLPWQAMATPATDGASIWLPARVPDGDDIDGYELYKAMAMSQAARIRRGAATQCPPGAAAGAYLAFEACSAEHDLLIQLPGLEPCLASLRRWALRNRPAMEQLRPEHRPLETLVRDMLGRDPRADARFHAQHPALSVLKASEFCARTLAATAGGGPWLFLDLWTGALLPPSPSAVPHAVTGQDAVAPGVTRSARLPRRPQARKEEQDRDARRNAWMIQTAHPEEHAESIPGMSKPVDRDEQVSPDELADSLSELPEVSVVNSPERPKEIFVTDDPIQRSSRSAALHVPAGDDVQVYPEWDYRAQDHSAVAHVRPMALEAGSAASVDQALVRLRPRLIEVQHQFRLLRAAPVRMRKLLDGDDIDLQAQIDSIADLRAGSVRDDRIYEALRPARRSLAVSILVDVSGSTDSWAGSGMRVIDVERDALMVVAEALHALGEPFSIQAFSGHGAHDVRIASVKAFAETYGRACQARIAGLEPQDYTRVGAALRHASAALMTQQADHRLLLLLSDGKPNDADDYGARYGIEDMRMAVLEARQSGIHPFCLTADPRSSAYLSHGFGPAGYQILTRPQDLTRALIQYLRALIRN